MEMENVYHVYYWKYPASDQVYHEAFATEEDAWRFYDEILARGPEWDAYFTDHEEQHF